MRSQNRLQASRRRWKNFSDLTVPPRSQLAGGAAPGSGVAGTLYDVTSILASMVKQTSAHYPKRETLPVFMSSNNKAQLIMGRFYNLKLLKYEP
ncbi:hypothetical protein [Nitrosococcus wardiae]|uniref:Uncharacterized protein n=1 Tax=Nitrosococcus wardiae TaxID=1814290 RepID=A0A4P7BWK2_9GAMM|nr:hypothetical protein [Nitrosococcus wardiae]QBQ54468.1 hypothetical protein E3U44_08080 [Nitrosococcus wardiae]